VRAAASRLRGLCGKIKFNRTAVTYDTLRKECLDAIKQWPGCETIAGVRLIGDTSPAGFSVKVTLYGRANKRTADRAILCVQREKRRHYRLAE
jgi:hypothetical protein